MSLDLFQDQNERHLAEIPVTNEIEPSIWDGFIPGTSQMTMKSFAETGRAVSMAGAAIPIAYDYFSGGTEMQDKYFKFHDDVFGRAVDYWTPSPGSVGTAGEVVGTLLGTLPLVMASPAAAVAKTQLTTAEDLTRIGVDSTKAQAVAGVQAVGFGLGVWLPILGSNLTTRTLVGGAGANVALGVVERATSDAILEGTPAERMYEAFDPKMLTLDVLMGLAFGTLAHISPAQRAQGAEFWNRMQEWGKKLEPSDIEAMSALRQAQHMDADSLPGKPVDMSSIDAHHARMEKAVDQLIRDEPVRVDDMPEAKIEPDKARIDDNEARFNQIQEQASRIRDDEGIIDMPEIKSPQSEVVVSKSDPLTDASTRFAEENTEMRIPIGKDAEGTDVHITPKAMLKEADVGVKSATENARLFKTAAACLMGII